MIISYKIYARNIYNETHQSDNWSNHNEQTLKFTFDQSIIFNRLTIQKGVKQSEYYKNVCLVLDDDETNQLCTDTRNGGFNGLSNTNDNIIWNQISFETDLSRSL